MTVERPETLDLMQRDQRALQQALQQAGLDSSKTNLEFSLRQNPFSQQGGMGDGRGGQPGFAGRGDGFGTEDTAAESQQPPIAARPRPEDARCPHERGRHPHPRISLKLLDVKDVKVGDFLPALVLTPVIVEIASLF